MIDYKEHPIEKDIPVPERGKGTGRNQRLAAKMEVGDSVLIDENRAGALANCIKKLGGRAITEHAGERPSIENHNHGEMVRHRRVWRVA